MWPTILACWAMTAGSIWLFHRSRVKHYNRGLIDGWDKAIRMSRAGLKPYTTKEMGMPPKGKR